MIIWSNCYRNLFMFQIQCTVGKLRDLYSLLRFPFPIIDLINLIF